MRENRKKSGGTEIKRRRGWKSFTHQAQTAFLLQIDDGNVQSLDMEFHSVKQKKIIIIIIIMKIIYIAPNPLRGSRLQVECLFVWLGS